MGQKPENFCDTTQIDILIECPLASRTIIRATLITGVVPVRLYLKSKQPSKVHLPARGCFLYTGRKLSVSPFCQATTLYHRFNDLL